ncbi:MAG: hypothetical protein JWN71_2765 [Xanthobacteraceae bacterium]|nr:hypothetical protein [Xanthobacteraceae bacterium]
MTEPYSDPLTARPAARTAPVARGSSGKWGWIVGLVILALIAAFVFTRENNNNPTATAKPPATSSAPAPSGASIQPSTTSQPPASGQPSPQGPAGPINTQSGGAPAASPQGETPPGMQSAPQGSQAPAPSEQSRPTR